MSVKSKASAAIEQVNNDVDCAIEAGKRRYRQKRRPLEGDALEVAISGAFNTLAVAAVTLMVVVFVVGAIADSIELSENADDTETDPDPFFEAYETIVNTTGDALNLAAVALIVLIAAVILFLVRGFGQNGAPGTDNGRM